MAQILFRRAAEAQGLSVHFDVKPSRRCLHDVSKGTNPGTPALGYSSASQDQFAHPLRDAQVDVSRSSASTDLVFVVRTGSRVRWDGTQLIGNSSPVMVRPATPTSAAWLNSHGIPFQTDAATVKQIGQMIAAKRGDVALLLAMEAELLHRQAEFSGQLQTLVPKAATAHGYAVFNREFAEANRLLVEAIWNEIGRIRASAEWKSLAAKFELVAPSGSERVSSSVPARQ